MTSMLSSMTDASSKSMSKEERRQKRKSKGRGGQSGKAKLRRLTSSDGQPRGSPTALSKLWNGSDNELFEFSSTLNNVYHLLGREPPFTTIVIAGMQSTGKSTLVERFLGIPLNIVQHGTGTRCPLHVTAIHDPSCKTPLCELRGKELDGDFHPNLNSQEAFARINKHTEKLSNEDAFSVEPLYLTFRAHNVENLRFIDTPGIISTASDGEQDNREEIQIILRHLFTQPNTKLCLLLQTNEFDTNPIIDFCDETFAARENWVSDNTTCIMTKFDKQVGDTFTGTRANNFFRKFHENRLYPFLVYTPILTKDNLKGQQLYRARQTQLATADEKEKELFAKWRAGHERTRQEDPSEETLNPYIGDRVGFAAAKKHLRELLLHDIRDRLPEVMGDLSQLKADIAKKFDAHKKKNTLYDEKELKKVACEFIFEVEQKVFGYLNGDLHASIKFKDCLQTLGDEIEDEEDSEWKDKELNHYTKDEDLWRDKIADYESDTLDAVQPDQNFLGGKQIQRAINFFGQVLLTAIPDPKSLEEHVPNCTGFLVGGLNRENWEQAMKQIVQVCVHQACHPGINHLIKHVGCILRNLFGFALEDVKQSDKNSAMFQLMPNQFFEVITVSFDCMLWKIMESAAEKTHSALEPMYETIDPSLMPPSQDTTAEPLYRKNTDGEYEEVKPVENEEPNQKSWRQTAQQKVVNFGQVRELLEEETMTKAKSKNYFLPEERSSMTTQNEGAIILHRAHGYIINLMETNLVINLRFQLHKYLFNGFKEEFRKNFKNTMMEDGPWEELSKPEPGFEAHLADLEKQMDGINDALQKVDQLQAKMT